MIYIITGIKSVFIFSFLGILYLPNRLIFIPIKAVMAIISIPYVPYLLILSIINKQSLEITAINNFGIGLIKLGQFLATRSDIVGNERRKRLSILHEKIPPIKYKKVKQIIDKDITVERNPVATASIAQVHKGYLPDGTIVAVKIIKPHIKAEIIAQGRIMYVFGWMLLIFRIFRKIDILTIISEIRKSLIAEADLEMEAAAMCSFKDRLLDDSIVIPKVYWTYTKTNVLVMEWINGSSLNDITLIESMLSYDRTKIAKKILEIYLAQIYKDGIFHADPHQGNIIITPEKKIALVDFGRIGYISQKEKQYILQIMECFLAKKYDKVALLYKQAGYVPNNVDLFKFEMACRIFGEKVVGKQSKQISMSEVLSHTINIATNFGMKAQKSLVSFNKTVAMLEGILLHLDPDINPWDIARDWLKHNPKNRLHIVKEKISDIISAIKNL